MCHLEGTSDDYPVELQEIAQVQVLIPRHDLSDLVHSVSVSVTNRDGLS